MLIFYLITVVNQIGECVVIAKSPGFWFGPSPLPVSHSVDNTLDCLRFTMHLPTLVNELVS